MEDDWLLDDYQKLFEAELATAFEAHPDAESDSQGIIERTLASVLPQVADLLHKELTKRSRAMLREHRGLRRGFVKRNMSRWRGGFDLLERQIVISQETGGAINIALRPNAVETNDALFEAVISNHARAVQVAREILTLLIAGFADGAMGRWRTLHEIAVVSSFLGQAGKEAAERYILQDHVTSHKRAVNYMKHHERANLEPIEPEVLAQLKAAHDEILATYPRMDGDYGWAAVALNKDRPTFADLEIATGLDHWRPRYKWATVNTHGAYRVIGSTLAGCESEEPVLLVGESNSGMTDPAHMTSISLNLATMPVIMLEPNVDRLAAALILDRLPEEIGETFWRLERETLARARLERLAAT